MQDNDTAGAEAMQALRVGVFQEFSGDPDRILTKSYSGDKKTKGAALVF